MNKNTIFATIVVAILVVCVVPLASSEQSDGLTGDSTGMSLNVDSAVIYVSGTPNYVSLNVATAPAGVSAENATWAVADIGDGTSCVTLSENGSSATVTAASLGSASVASVKVTATIIDTDAEETYHASAIVVVYASSSATATSFHYYVKIDQSAIPSSVSVQTTGFTDGHTIADFYTGFWIEVKQSNYTGAGAWNAMNAFQWYCDQYGWNCSASSSGWISTILNLGTYQGSGSDWIYWSQFHAEGNSWVFNNTTMGYITSVSESYIGLLFRVSTSATDTVTFPGYPEATA